MLELYISLGIIGFSILVFIFFLFKKWYRNDHKNDYEKNRDEKNGTPKPKLTPYEVMNQEEPETSSSIAASLITTIIMLIIGVIVLNSILSEINYGDSSNVTIDKYESIITVNDALYGVSGYLPIIIFGISLSLLLFVILRISVG